MCELHRAKHPTKADVDFCPLHAADAIPGKLPLYTFEEDVLEPDISDLRDLHGVMLGRVSRRRDRWFVYLAGEEEARRHAGDKTTAQAILISLVEAAK